VKPGPAPRYRYTLQVPISGEMRAELQALAEEFQTSVASISRKLIADALELRKHPPDEIEED
jgi:hypothetical protein